MSKRKTRKCCGTRKGLPHAESCLNASQNTILKTKTPKSSRKQKSSIRGKTKATTARRHSRKWISGDKYVVFEGAEILARTDMAIQSLADAETAHSPYRDLNHWLHLTDHLPSYDRLRDKPANLPGVGTTWKRQ